VAEKECWEMAQYNRCVNNIMEGSADSFSFTASPEGDGVWMQTKEYSVINCMRLKIIIRKDCLYCPITSPFGLLTNSSEVSFVRRHDSVIVWDATKANISGQCNLRELKSGSGFVSAYLRIIAQDWTHISNAETKLCLDNNLEEVKCTSQKTQEFVLHKNELALNLTHLAKAKKNCLMPIWLRISKYHGKNAGKGDG
jgi:hypothetical protein